MERASNVKMSQACWGDWTMLWDTANKRTKFTKTWPHS